MYSCILYSCICSRWPTSIPALCVHNYVTLYIQKPLGSFIKYLKLYICRDIYYLLNNNVTLNDILSVINVFMFESEL